MTTLLQILLYLWIAITAMLLVTWYLRRRTAVDVPPVELEVAIQRPRVAVNSVVADQPAGRASGESGNGDPEGADEVESERSKPRQAMHPALLGTAGQAPWSTDPVYASRSESDANDHLDPANGDLQADADDRPADSDTTDAQLDITDDGIDEIDTDTTDAEPEEFNAVTDDQYDRRRTLTEERMDSVEGPVDGSGVALPDVHARVLTDMLDGIKLPYDLTPITSAVEDPDRHLVFLTTHSNAEEVGTRFADEMIRLGYAFTPIGLDQAIATRDDDIVSLLIAPKADEVLNASGPRYGAAGPGDVALELWIGRSSAPPSTAG